MDDADGIIIPILRSIGCSIPDDVKSAAQFEAALLVHALAKCLHKINEQKYQKIVDKLPNSIAKRVRIGTLISDAMKSLHYRADVGYDKIIYPNEKDTRSLLRFVVQKLPKEEKKLGTNAPDGADDEDELIGEQALDQRIYNNLKQWMNKPYSSVLSKPQRTNSFRTISLDYPTQPSTSLSNKYYASTLSHIPTQVSSCYSHLVPSLLAHNHKQYLLEQSKTYISEAEDDALMQQLFGTSSAGNEEGSLWSLLTQNIRSEVSAAKEDIKKHETSHTAKQSFSSSRSKLLGTNRTKTAFELQKNYTQQQAVTAQAVDDEGKLVKVDESGQQIDVAAQEEDAEATKAARKQELNGFKAEIMKLQERLKKMEAAMEKQQTTYASKEDALKKEEERYQTLQRSCMTKKKTLDLLPNAEENLKKLAKIVAASQNRYDGLRDAWQAKKQVFVGEFERRKNELEGRKTRANDLLSEIKQMRKEMRECAQEIRSKEAQVAKYVSKLNRLPKTIDRQVYVERILGVVSNLENQNNQIKNILNDVQELQRDSNLVVDKSKRVFGIVDNLVFSAASAEKDVAAKRELNQVYRQVVSMREYFDMLVDTARCISNTQNETRDLEYQIVALKEKVEGLEMKKIKADLKKVEQENEELAKRLKALKKELKKSTR